MIRSKTERAAYVQKVLAKLYPDPPIPLDHFDNYSLLVSVLLSAQCTDVRVNKTTPALWKLAKTPAQMAKQKIADVREIIKPCGLSPMKSKAIVELSKILTEKYKGRVPDTFEELESLPGVGH